MTVQRSDGVVQLISEDKLNSQAETYEWVEEGYEALPLSGSGRWIIHSDGTIIYTNDQRKLFVRNKQGTTNYMLNAVLEIHKLYSSGLTATEAFERLSSGAPVTTGDLSELA